MNFWAPVSLNQIVGNTRSLELLRAILENRDRAPSCYVFDGLNGVGKNTMAKLFFHDLFPDVKPKVVQPEFFSQILQQEDLDEYTCLIWDHAERLSTEQADQLCAYLDRSDVKTVSIFLCVSYNKVHKGLRARALRIPCLKPSRTDMVGLLGSICASHHLNFELEALNLIAARSSDIPSRAILDLQATSVVGDITVGTVRKLQVNIEEQAIKLLSNIDHPDIMKMAGSIKDMHPMEELIDTLFEVYSMAFYDSTKSLGVIAEKLSNYIRVGDIFIKWKSVITPPPSALFILIKELADSRKAVELPVLISSPSLKKEVQRAPIATEESWNKIISEASNIGDSSIR